MQSNQDHLVNGAADRQRSPLAPFVLIPKLFFTRYNPSWKAVLAYTAMKYYTSNESQSCEGISIKTFANRVGTSEDTMKRGIAELVRKQVLKVRGRSLRSKMGARIPIPNLYELADIQPDGGSPI